MKQVISAFFMFMAMQSMAVATCNSHFRGQGGTRSEGLVTGVAVGQPCTIPVYLGGSGRTSIAGVVIVRPPKFGSLAAQGSSLIYTPKAGFTGRDSFFVRFPFQDEHGKRKKGAGIRFLVR